MRNKTVLITGIVCLVLFIAALGTVIWQQTLEPAEEIEILLDGETIYRGDAIHSGSPLYIDASGKYYTNHIQIDENGAKVESSTCPNAECVKMGYLKNRYLPVVCLPNNLIIRYVERQSSSDSGLDAISR